jgi:Aspartyl protease
MVAAGVARKDRACCCRGVRSQVRPSRGQRMIHLSILRPRSDSIAPSRPAAILAATPRCIERARLTVVRTSPPPRYRLRYLALAVLLLTPLPNRAHSNPLRLPFRTVRSMILVEGEVNGNPVTLLMDTGSMKTIISTRAYRVEYFSLRTAQRSAKSAGISGESISVRLDLKLANHRWVGQPVSIMNLGELNQLLGAQFDGLLGEDILREFHSVRIDYRAHIIEFED